MGEYQMHPGYITDRNAFDGLAPMSSASRQPIFGSQSNNVSPTLPEFAFDEAQIESQDADFGPDDGTDGKRRRIAKACDMCRKKKIKCDGRAPSCSHCINYKTECHFTQLEKKRNPPKGAKYIEGLENRLARMEILLKLSGLARDGEDLGTLEKRLLEERQIQGDSTYLTADDGRAYGPVAQISRVASPHQSPQADAKALPKPLQASPALSRAREGEVEELSDMMCSLVTNNSGETRYIGSSSSFSIFSPKGVQWVNEKTGDSSFQDMISSAAITDVKWAYWKPEVFSDMFARRTWQQLPSRDEALSLLKDYFENFNCMFPLFHEPTFMHLVHRQYSQDPYEGSGWWASLNMALAIAHRLRVMSNLVPCEEDKKAWGFLKNAMGVLTELTMRNTDLFSMQALLGMALFLMGTPNPQPSFFLVAAAIRLASTIGLHKRGSAFNLNAVENEQRKRVFWIAYLLDKDICLRSGRPPAQDDDDMNVELPSEDPSDNIGNIPLADGKGKANLFRFMITFAIIESKVYKQLYSTKAAKQSDGALLNTIGDLDKELEEWKDAIPIDFRPDHEIKASHTPLMLHVVVLHFAYYNCLTTIHRMSVHHGYWTSRLSNYAIQGLNARPLNPRVFNSAALCVQAARSSIDLVRYIPQGDYSCVWLILYFPVSALVTLFANILQNPQDPRARSDVKLMNQVVNFLSLLAVTEEQGGVKRMLGVCVEFERIASVVLERSDKESARKRRRSSKPANGTDSHGATSAHAHISPRQHMPLKRTAPSMTPQSDGSHTPPSTSSQNIGGGVINGIYSPNFNTFSSPPSTGDVSVDFPKADTDFSSFTALPSSNGLDGGSNHAFNSPGSFHFSVSNDDPGTLGSTLKSGSFEQPFVPQDLWQMPMTLEWDWADISSLNGFGEMPTTSQNLDEQQRPRSQQGGMNMPFGTEGDVYNATLQ